METKTVLIKNNGSKPITWNICNIPEKDLISLSVAISSSSLPEKVEVSYIKKLIENTLLNKE